MRQIGTLATDVLANRFTSHLATLGIDAIAEQDGDAWTIWVREEDQRGPSTAALLEFQSNPNDARYQGAEKAAESLRRERSRRAESAHRAIIDIRGRWRAGSRAGRRRPPVTMALVFLTGLVTLGGWFGKLPPKSVGGALYRELHFTDRSTVIPGSRVDSFMSIRAGEAWRLITPIFLHFDAQHLIFNMIMFYYLAGQMERLRGPVRLGALIAVVAVVSNVAEASVSMHGFGGMSGVVYGLLGYVWMKSINEPASGFHIDQLMLILAIAWFFLCWFDVLGMNVANYAHAGGLASGIAIGLLPSGRVGPAPR
ncbi:MAG: rhomboid family intramembrane serine protease [Planctomycetes bacterium]|nr:rhomboid family intramembrane serine protease [Planctomycetota bacterium]